MGGDFEYANAFENFDSTDRLIAYFNKYHGDKYQLHYSTPSWFIESLYAQGKTWPTNYYDMVPYGDEKNAYWSGFYTSRPNQKKFIRDG